MDQVRDNQSVIKENQIYEYSNDNIVIKNINKKKISICKLYKIEFIKIHPLLFLCNRQDLFISYVFFSFTLFNIFGFNILYFKNENIIHQSFES